MNVIMLQHIGTTRANMRIENGISVTDVVVDGVIIDTHPTQELQIRHPRKSLLWARDDSIDIDKVEEETGRRIAYQNDLDAKSKQGIHNAKRGNKQMCIASKVWNGQTS